MYLSAVSDNINYSGAVHFSAYGPSLPQRYAPNLKYILSFIF